MRSVLTILIFLALLGCVLLYNMGRLPTLNGADGAYGSWFYSMNHGSPPVVEKFIEDKPCSTDLDCGSGTCSMFGMCSSGLSF